jgi:hypothetical protein
MTTHCLRCELPGEHRTTDDCLTAIRNVMRTRGGLPPLPVVIRPPKKPSRTAKAEDYNPELLTIAQACAVTQMARRTITNWIKAGKIERIYTAGGAPRIVAASLWRRI